MSDILHALVEDFDNAYAALRAHLTGVAAQAETDATKVVETAETSGVDAAVHQAETDAVGLAATAVADVTTAPATPAAPTA
jgi:hypothetical protein